MKIVTTLKAWFNDVRMHIRMTNEMNRTAKLENLSCETINVIEFDGRLYIAFHGVPIVRVDDIKVKAPELLAQARADYLAWKAKFDK